jgi:MraZ protein
VDGQGRILLPERLVNFAGLRQEVVLLGVHDHAEIWDKELWDQFLASHSPEFDELASEALS